MKAKPTTTQAKMATTHQHDVTSKTRAANRRLLPIDTGMSALYPTRKAKISAESVGAGPHGLP
jgi:hypothetical protein